MSNSSEIKTTKIIYPQIYAYTLPTIPEKDGWVKIGYTERKDVDKRIKEQTKTAAINLKYTKLWTEPAKFKHINQWFKDTQFHAYLCRYKKIKQEPNSEWFYYNGHLNQSHSDFEDFRNNSYEQSRTELTYQLRTEQQKAVKKTLAYAKKTPNGAFLWNAKPRFGKTLTTYDFIRQFDAHKVLIVTNRPAIANSWFDDFEKFISWQTDYAFVSTSYSLSDRPVMTREEFLAQQATGKKRLLTFISLQDLKGAISFGGSYDKLSWVKELKWDLLVIDEAHEGVDTFKTDIAFDNITRDFTLHLSGTPFKAVASGKFSADEIYNWSYVDEQSAKHNWDNLEENNPYEALPRLNLFSYQMSQMITEEVNKGAEIDGRNIDFAFDLNEFFATNDNHKFIYEADILKWLDTLTRNKKYPFSTPELRNELKHTFWLLDRVASAKALQKLLKNHPVFENYKVILAAGDGQNEDEPFVNQKSLDKVKEAIAHHDKTITLSVGQLTTGVTIPEWTAVLILSNIKSPSLYMQAAFRAQNPWAYESNGSMHQKENAYVFDFAPERTLIIYDEFANNLSNKTANGGGTTADRKNNIQQLLNFFPVIAEDNDGEMVELDVDQVLTIPKTIKAQEIVRRGFMSNLLFQNISGIFASLEAREILEQLNPVEIGKATPKSTNTTIDTKEIELDDEGNVTIDMDIVIAQTDAHFGEKVYADITSAIEEVATSTTTNLPKIAEDAFKDKTGHIIKELAKERGLTANTANKIIEQSAKTIAREIEVAQKHSEIKQAEAKIEYEQKIAESFHNDPVPKEQVEAEYQTKKQQIEEEFKKTLITTVETKTKELTQQSTESVLKEAENRKKNAVENDVRARLRGFTRTIPSFLMAYGQDDTTLQTFDKIINDNVFKEVTGITLDQFRILRDQHQFFDEIAFNESVQEFLRKRQELANYFDENQKEDIFDYIPPQRTNQIFTPKKVVKMMVNALEEENPGIFTDPNKTFADLYMKSGLYITEIVKRLYQGLENKIPDSEARLKHILENQVYGFAPSEIIYNIAKNFIFGFDERAKNIDDSHIVFLDTTPYAKGEEDFEMICNELFGGKQ